MEIIMTLFCSRYGYNCKNKLETGNGRRRKLVKYGTSINRHNHYRRRTVGRRNKERKKKYSGGKDERQKRKQTV
jgi:hypothetical protein